MELREKFVDISARHKDEECNKRRVDYPFEVSQKGISNINIHRCRKKSITALSRTLGSSNPSSMIRPKILSSNSSASMIFARICLEKSCSRRTSDFFRAFITTVSIFCKILSNGTKINKNTILLNNPTQKIGSNNYLTMN